MGNAQTLLPPIAHAWERQIYLTSLGTNQNRALKAGMGWWENSTLIFTCCFYGLLEARPDVCSLFRCRPHQATAQGTSSQGLPRLS